MVVVISISLRLNIQKKAFLTFDMPIKFQMSTYQSDPYIMILYNRAIPNIETETQSPISNQYYPLKCWIEINSEYDSSIKKTCYMSQH